MKKTFRQLLDEERPLILPVAHDALSARLIEAHGCRAYSIGGFALAGVRYGLPDIGLVSFGEAVAGVRDIMSGSALPVLVDADDGYGDVKNVTRTVRTYEAMGVAGILLEDQTSPKRCGHMAGKSVVELEVAERKLEAALAARTSDDFFIIARTDARTVLGLDEAMRRAERFQEIGVDAIFVEALLSVEELERVGGSFRIPVVATMPEVGRTPMLPVSRLSEMGYAIIVYPATLLLRVVSAIQDGLRAITEDDFAAPYQGCDFDQLTGLMGIREWAEVDEKFGPSPTPAASGGDRPDQSE